MPQPPAGEPARAPRASERWLDALEALLWVALLAAGSAVALAAFRESEGAAPPAPAPAPGGLVEAEALAVVGKSRDFLFWLQPTDSFPGGRWSEDGQMLALETRAGDWIELALPEAPPGRRRLELFLTRAADYGVVQVSLNGVPLGDAIDLFAEGVRPTGALDLGAVELRGGGDDVLRLEVVGTNPRSAPPHHQFGIDGLRLSAP